ncbi:MAG: hypothetical protein J6P99_03820 [Paludibacteraceae bacterium]|nr:hypothetical protein [Paludibacteraceae bacterium]
MRRLLLYGLVLPVMLLVGCGRASHTSGALLVDSLYRQGRYFLDVHCYDSALVCFAKAEEAFDEHTSVRYKGKIYANLASLHKDAGVFDVALDYSKKSLHAYELISDTACVLLSWLDIADVYVKMGGEDRYQYAQKCYDKALSYFGGYCNDSIKGRIYQEKGIKYVHDNKLDSGLYYLYKSLTYPAQGNGSSIRNLYVAVAYQKKGEVDSAKHYVDETLKCPNGIRQRSGCYNILWSIACDEKDTLAMSRYSSILVAYKDSILRLENQAAREVVKLNNSSHETMKSVYLRSYVLWGSLLVGVLLCVFVLLDYERRRRTQLSEARLTLTVDSLQAKLDEEQNKKIYDRKTIEEQLVSLKHSVVESGIMQSNHWRGVNQESSHRYFYALMDKMCLSFPFLTERELQICMLVLMHMNNDEMSKILFLSPNSIGKTKQRVAQRLGTSAGQLREFLLQHMS